MTQGAQGLWDNLEGWDGGCTWEGTHVYLWQIHADVWQKPTPYCKATILQLKMNTLKKKKQPRLCFPHTHTHTNK